jgi:molybdopterin-guanine dinucleotide biosynthesis protein A
MSILGVILAGGQSTRMGGGDKTLLPLAGKPLLQHVIDRLQGQVNALVLNANGDPKRFDDFNLPIAADSIDGFAGPLAGILAGMDYAAIQGHSHIVTAAGDTPFFPDDLAHWLFEGCYKINIAKTPSAIERHSFHPTFGLWDVALRDQLRTALEGDMRKVMGFVKQHPWRSVEWTVGEFDPFFNVNTAQDMTQAEQIVRRQKT